MAGLFMLFTCLFWRCIQVQKWCIVSAAFKKKQKQKLWDYSGLFGLHTNSKNVGGPNNIEIKTDVFLI